MSARIPPVTLRSVMSFVTAVCILLLATSSATAAADLPPAEAFFGARAFHSARLSPNGEWLAVIHERDGLQLIVVRALAGGEPRAIAQFEDEDFRLQRLVWANDERLLVAGQFAWHGAPGADVLATNLFGIDRDGKDLRNLGSQWPEHQRILRHDRITHMLPDDPKHVLLTLRPARKNRDDVYRLNVYTGQLSRVVQGKRHIDTWYADPDGVVRVGTGIDDGRIKVVARVDADAKFETIAAPGSGESGPGLRFVGFTRDPRILLVAARRPHPDDLAADRLAVFEYSLTARELGRLVFAHPEVDVAGPALVDPSTDEVIGIRYWLEGEERHYLDADAGRLHRAIDRAIPGATNVITDHSRDGNTLIVRSTAPDRAPRTHALLRGEKEMVELFVERPALEQVQLARPQPVRYRARDGAVIPGYLTLPSSGTRDGLPTIVMPHGDPRSRDTLRYDPIVQFLANRGYAVLQMNHRGTSGYGVAHRNAGLEGASSTVENDVADGVRWLISEGHADPDRIAIYGSQYGANAALRASAASPELFRCAASFSGVFDLTLQSRETRLAAAWSREQRVSASAIDDAGLIRIPVLLGHAGYDPVVSVKQSRRMAKALRRRDRAVELIVYDDDRGPMREETALAFFTDLDRFLTQYTRPTGADPIDATPASPSPR